jgi:hypothetical protein
VSSNQLHLFQGYTLVDITPTGQVVYSTDAELARNQQRNWETVQQILSLRTQPQIIKTYNLIEDVSNHHFGIHYTGKQSVWSFIFGVEYPEVYSEGPDVFGLLKYDFNYTPVILGLTESTKPNHAMFYPSGPWNNIYFKTLANDK